MSARLASTRTTRRLVGPLLAASIIAAACSSIPPVAVERSDRSGAGPVIPDGQASLPPIGSPAPDAGDTELPIVDSPETSIEWGDCDSFGAPSPDRLGTSGWECGTLETAMDPFGDGAGDGALVQLALTRHRATGDRRGAILLNPGGPGGEGLATVWNVRGAMPADMLRAFDIVSWDPRGVGESTPKIDCNDEVPPGDPTFISECVRATGALAGFITAPYSAADMEAIRVALGEDELNYLGYSYGSILGATYAAEYSDRVGSFVLDGATDPAAGSPAGPFEDGFAVLADDGTEAARNRFVELCNASERCLFSLDAGTVISDLAFQVPVLSTSDFGGAPDRVDSLDFERLIDSSMSYAGDWELLATALEDADRGDASALASLIAGENARNSDGDDGESGDADGAAEDDGENGDSGPSGESDFAEANFMIYCADLGPQITEWAFCDAMPDGARPMEAVQAVDVRREVLVIGTEFDPLTPGYHAPEFAAALGDAVHIIWDGVGHTAFPGWTPCIDDVVADQFLRRSLPEDGLRCSFLPGLANDEQLGDNLFGHGDIESANLLERILDGRDLEPGAACMAAAVNQAPDRVISHVVLEITSDDAGIALDTARSSC
ncbi:MAG: alpha/beta fold hydrolase [Ilumatobacter sp.]